MTNITIFKNKEGTSIGYEMKGHAGYANMGYDILCASLSTVNHVTITGLLRNHDVLSERIVRVSKPKEGHSKVILPRAYHMNIVDISFIDAFRVFVTALEQQYGDYMTVTEIKLKEEEY